MGKKKEHKPITLVVLNPEALDYASEKVTQYYYEKYLEMIREGLIEDKSNVGDVINE